MELTVRVRTNLGQYRVTLNAADLSLVEIKKRVEQQYNVRIISNFSLSPTGEEITEEAMKLQNIELLYCRCESNDNTNSGKSTSDSKILIKKGEIVSKSSKTKATLSLSSKPNKIKSVKVTSTTEDIANDLITALNGDRDKKSKILRKCFGDALMKQYDETQAIYRLDAGLNNQYQIKISNNHRIFGLLESFTMTINYHGDKNEYTDVIDLIPLPLLKECIKAGYESNKDNESHGKEILKPINLSKISPRIFWSIIQLYKSSQNSSNNQSFIQAYKDIFPDFLSDDLSFLYDRRLTLSEKALENKRQQDEKQLKKAQEVEKRKNKKQKTQELNEQS